MYGGKVRPKTGAPGIFPPDMEEDLALYMKHCDLLRIPKTRKNLQFDIRHYVNYHNLQYQKLEEDGPGEGPYFFFLILRSSTQFSRMP